MSMPADVFEMYWEAMRVIDAQEMMRAMTLGDYPHAGKDTRRKIHRQVHREAYPGTWDKGRSGMTMDQFFGKPMVKNGE